MNNIKHLENIRSSKVLITGGLGFVGHNLAKSLIHDYNCEVTILDNMLNSKESILKDIGGSPTFINASVIDVPLEGFLEHFDYIFHLACIQIAHSGKDPFLDLQTNATSTLRILEYLRHHEHNIKRFVYTSSASVYGNAQNGLCVESGPTKVLSQYASTKLLGENYTSIYFKQYGVPTSSVRYSNVFGNGQTPQNTYCGVIGKFINASVENQELFIFGDGQQTRDYTYISDAVSATILAAVHPLSMGEVFNVGTGTETSVNELAEMIIDYTGSKSNIGYHPPRDIDNIRRRFTDINSIQDRLGWEPAVTIQRGLKFTIDWYNNQPKED